MKILHYALFASALSMCVCACAVAPSPTAPTTMATLDASLAAAGGAESSFSRAFLQNGYEAPDHIEPIKVLRGPLRIYLRTQDDAGRAIDEASLNLTQRVLNEAAWIWSGETFRITEVTRGTGSRERTPGWITVKWSTASADRCGRSTVGVDGGSIEFNTSGSCSCGLSTLIYPRLIRHELGHAMGYYHTDGPGDVMFGRSITPDACDLLPSDRERRQAKLIHSSGSQVVR